MINFGPGEVLRTKRFKHQYSTDSRDWIELAHADKKAVAVFLLLGFEKLDGTGPRVDVNEVLRAFGWTLPKLLPVGTRVDYNMVTEYESHGSSYFVPATITAHVEGWYELTFLADGSKATVRPSRVHHESDDQ